jgi:hypothetical protein
MKSLYSKKSSLLITRFQKSQFFCLTKLLCKFIVAFLVFLSFANILHAQVTETEPNNTPAQANILPLNNIGKGAINPAGDVDWYKVTTTSDGQLSLSINHNSAYISLYFYDNNGVTLLNHTDYIGSGGGAINTDGLAAGTYYIKVYCTNAGDTSSYTVSNTLTTTGIANDTEPDSTDGLALTLPLNDSTTGHVGYYYNNHRDSADWYKVTTNADGQLSLYISDVTHYLSVYLYDNDGVTQLNHADYIGTQGTTINTDGLAAGTYYVKVYCTNINTEFTPYKLTDSLFTPAQANDNEPDSSRATALTLLTNSTTTGHVGYYYNNHRDSTDWYKVTTNADGQLSLYISNNTHYLSVYLYDNDGVTQLNHADYIDTRGTTINTDGLAAGTYYVKVFCTNINTEFTPYTLKDSLFTYKFAADTAAEPNNYAYLAKTLLANRLTTGHTGFYYNLVKDSSDWWKINYTGTGALQITLNFEPNILHDNGLRYFSYRVYSDTTAAAISSGDYINSSPYTINLGSLPQQYYYVKLFTTNTNTDYEAYSIADSFIQVKVAAISLLKSSSQNVCGTDSIIYSLSGSHPPYTVRLYRNGALYDSLTTASDSAVFVGLNNGNYYATVYGDGATGNAFAQASSVALLPPVPTGLNATNITGNSATLSWSMLSCTNYDTLEYRANDSATWKILITKDNSGVYDLTNLAGNTTYLFRVTSVVSGNGPAVSSGYSATFTFKTVAVLPVTLLNFSATANNDLVTLNWSTATEINNKGFEIFRSADGSNFTSIGFVAGAGNSDLLLNYQFTDRPRLSGNVFYRLKQIDLDANFVWSNIVSVTIKGQGLITFVPNPAKSFITISSPVVLKQVRLLAMNGQMIKAWQNVSPNAQLDLGTIASGTYLIEFFDGQSVQTVKLVKSN